MEIKFRQYEKAELVRSDKWHEVVLLSEAEVKSLHEKWKTTEIANVEIYANIIKVIESEWKQVTNLFSTLGIVWKRSGSKIGTVTPEKWEKWAAEVYNRIKGKYDFWSRPSMPYAHPNHNITVRIQGVEVSICRSPTDIIELHAALTSQLNSAQKTQDEVNRRRIEAMRIAIDRNMNIEGKTIDQIASFVNNVLKDEFEKAELVEGREISINDDYCGCESYTIGSHRCSCGNRRINVYVEGNFLNGFYITTEPY